MSLTVRGFGLSDIGRVRRRNEDEFYLSDDGTLGIVADGMGGGPAGDVAAQTAVKAAREYLTEARAELAGDPRLSEAQRAELLRRQVQSAVEQANESVLAKGDEDPRLAGMGCTLTVLAFDPLIDGFAIGHIGDSRAYRLANGTLEQLTHDHTLAQESVEQGRLTVDAARDHPFGHILTRVLGLDREIQPQTISGSSEPGEAFLLCTDGLIRVFRDEELLSAINRSPDLGQTAQWLIEEANRRGGPDNATLVLMRLQE